MALLPPPHLRVEPPEPVRARRLRRVAGLAGLTGGAMATTLGVQALLTTGAQLLDWTLTGVGLALLAFGMSRLRPRDVPPELTIQPARVHFLYGLCLLALGVAAPALGMSRWLTVVFGACGLVELALAAKLSRRSGRPPA